MDASNATTPERLRAFIDQIERLESEKAGIAEDIRDKYAEAKSIGFDTKIIRELIKRRKWTREQREEFDALLDLYSAAIGDLNGTPLGEAAIKRLRKDEEKKKWGEAPPPSFDESEAEEEQAAEPREITEQDLSEARTLGKTRALEGKPVTDNPFPAHDPRRAAYDEGWCQAAGSDGMDIPDAWKRTEKAKKKDDEAKEGGAE